MVGVHATSANHVSSKVVSGQAAAHRCEAPGFARFRGRALRASLTDSSRLFERSGLRREVSSATGHGTEQTQGSRCEAPTALSMRRGLPGHDFAACLLHGLYTPPAPGCERPHGRIAEMARPKPVNLNRFVPA